MEREGWRLIRAASVTGAETRCPRPFPNNSEENTPFPTEANVVSSKANNMELPSERYCQRCCENRGRKKPTRKVSMQHSGVIVNEIKYRRIIESVGKFVLHYRVNSSLRIAK